jgi:hypothetical protein
MVAILAEQPRRLALVSNPHEPCITIRSPIAVARIKVRMATAASLQEARLRCEV